MYRCIRCDQNVELSERVGHSASQTHQDNGGSATVVAADYEFATGGGVGGVGTHGTSKIR